VEQKTGDQKRSTRSPPLNVRAAEQKWKNLLTFNFNNLGEKQMKNRKAFTLIELMVVILIVGVLAAILVPMMTSRIEAARWSEGKAGAGTIATALRAYIAEQGEEGVTTFTTLAIADFMNEAELTGKYFDSGDYDIADVTYDPSVTGEGNYQLTYTITVSPGSVLADLDWSRAGYELDEEGHWTEVSSSTPGPTG
jgi:prepilin-type N-terminal cleavage/methylation domain-containing protein